MLKIDIISNPVVVTKTPLFLLILLIIPFITKSTPILSSLNQDYRLELFERLKQLPLAFEANEGHFNSAVEFSARSLGNNIFFTPTGVTFSTPYALTETKPQSWPSQTLRIQFEGANPNPKIEGGDPLPAVVNYFTGNDPTQWRTNLPTFAGITYFELYPGIDLHYEGQQGQLKSTYFVAPGADPSQIAWHYPGADEVQIEAETGDLLVTVASDETGNSYQLREQAPIAWQTINGQRIPVEANYVLKNKLAAFSLGNYDPAYDLIIDPVTLAYSTYLGGNEFDLVHGITLDNQGYIYLTGGTLSSDFPTKSGYESNLGGVADIFVAKIDPSQSGIDSLLFSTYLGGNDIRANEGGLDIAVDNNGNIYVTGFTQADDFPTVNAYANSRDNPTGSEFDTSNDTFITKFSPLGNTLLYSSYLGGDEGNDDIAYGLAVDDVGNAYLGGLTQSVNFPVKNAYQDSIAGGPGFNVDAFITQIDTTKSGEASLIYSTYVGGSNADVGRDIALDNDGFVYLVGGTSSENFPVKNGFQNSYGGDDGSIVPMEDGGDIFVAKLDPTQSGSAGLVYSTYLGGSNNEAAEGVYLSKGISVDNDGKIYITGETSSVDFPVKNAYQGSYGGGSFDAIVAKLDPSKTGDASLIYSTFLGGSELDIGFDIAVDSSGQAYITGSTKSPDFPTVDAFQSIYGGHENSFYNDLDGDAFITKIDATGAALQYSSYIGTAQSEVGFSIAVDQEENIYIGGATNSASFPTKNGFANLPSASSDGFVMKFSSSTPGPVNAIIYLPIIIAKPASFEG